MPKRSCLFVGRLAAVSCAALLLLSGCGRMKESINANADLRKGAVENARKSCTQTAMSKLPNASPQLTAKVSSYCDCFATKGLQQFTNTELMEIGISGGKMTDEIKAKLNAGAAMCMANLQAPQP